MKTRSGEYLNMCSGVQFVFEVDGNLQGEAMGLGENGRRVARLVEEVKRGGEEMGGDRRKAMFKAFTASALGGGFLHPLPLQTPLLPLAFTSASSSSTSLHNSITNSMTV